MKKLIVPPSKRIMMPPKNGHWIFPETMNAGGKVGFVYVIRDMVLRRGYVGKKSYHKAGQINKGEETNWRHYKSSSNTMKGLFSQRPLDEFEFFVLEEYGTKGGLSYAETWTMCMLEVPTTPNWYNTRIEKVAWNVRENITFRHKARLEMVEQWPD